MDDGLSQKQQYHNDQLFRLQEKRIKVMARLMRERDHQITQRGNDRAARQLFIKHCAAVNIHIHSFYVLKGDLTEAIRHAKGIQNIQKLR
jgi:hypothetical protein